MRKILVLGGSVFIGRAIANMFVSCKDEVYVLNRGNNPCPKGAIQLIADRNDAKQLKSVLQNHIFDVVVDGSAYKEMQSKIIVDLLKKRVKHFIHISSAAVYEDSEIFPYHEYSKRGFSKAWGAYSKEKYFCEEVLFNAWEKENFPVTIIRPFYVYGYGNNLDRERYVFSRILNNEPIILPSRGENMVQFGHIEDLCNAIEKISRNTVCIGKAYNVSGSEYITLKGWVQECGGVLGIKPKIILVDKNVLGYKAREWFPFRDLSMIGNCELIKNHIGFMPKYSLFDGLKDTVDKEGIENLKGKFKKSKAEVDILENIKINPNN